MFDPGLSDHELFPLLDERGRGVLRRLREHPHAPRYNWRTGERLTAAMLESVRRFARDLRTDRAGWTAATLPPWVKPFVARCRAEVPFYRRREHWSEEFASLPLTTRDDVRLRPWEFVPDSQPPQPLITYTTSGTTGTRLQYLATPELPARYLPLIELALESVGVRLEGGERVSVVQVCAQRGTVVLCSISSYLGGAGFVKINLDPADWNHPADPVRFLEDCRPELYTGDPFALWRLAQLPLAGKPRAIISSAAALPGGLRRQLATRFDCPIVDVYSTNESGPIAFRTGDGAYVPFPGELYVEILDDDGRVCPAGKLGRIVVTGGLNPCLPLVRYPTGDYGRLESTDNARPVLSALHARSPVLFRDTKGEMFNSVDVLTALSGSSLAAVRLNQRADGSVEFRFAGDRAAGDAALRDLGRLFGPEHRIDVVHDLDIAAERKLIAFTSELPFTLDDLHQRGT